jgi:hypothetical protein
VSEAFTRSGAFATNQESTGLTSRVLNRCGHLERKQKRQRNSVRCRSSKFPVEIYGVGEGVAEGSTVGLGVAVPDGVGVGETSVPGVGVGASAE